MEIIIAAIIGLIGVVLGAIIQTVAPQITQKLFPQKNTRHFTGHWKCQWEITSPIEYKNIKPINDVVEITKVVGEKIVGKGTGPEQGTYVIEGYLSPFAIAFLYYGLGSALNQTGVILLKRADLSDRMSGSWYQYFDNKLVVGTTKWEKMDT